MPPPTRPWLLPMASRWCISKGDTSRFPLKLVVTMDRIITVLSVGSKQAASTMRRKSKKNRQHRGLKQLQQDRPHNLAVRCMDRQTLLPRLTPPVPKARGAWTEEGDITKAARSSMSSLSKGTWSTKFTLAVAMMLSSKRTSTLGYHPISVVSQTSISAGRKNKSWFRIKTCHTKKRSSTRDSKRPG